MATRPAATDHDAAAIAAEPAERPLRADARRNREAILKAARQVFGRDGAHAQMDDIARGAKVGVGTLYRHFPTKEALFHALALDHFANVTQLAREAAGIEDPWQAFETMLTRPAHMIARDRALAEVIATSPRTMEEAKAEQAELFTLGAAIMRRAQEAGVVRADARPDDIGIVMRGLCSLGTCGCEEVDVDRYLRIALDGFRASPTARPLQAS